MRQRIAIVGLVLAIGLGGWLFFRQTPLFNPLIGVWKGPMFAEPTKSYYSTIKEGSGVQIEFFATGTYEYDEQTCIVGSGSYKIRTRNGQKQLEIIATMNEPNIIYNIFIANDELKLVDQAGKTFIYKKLPERLPYGLQ